MLAGIIFVFIVIALFLFFTVWYSNSIKISPETNKKIEKYKKYGSYLSSLERSKIKSELNEEQLMKLSIIKKGVHVDDFIINKDRTLTIMPENKTIKLAKRDFKNLEKVESILQDKEITGCRESPFGDSGTFYLITVHGKEPMHAYGSICQDESGKAGGLFVGFCSAISEYY